MIVDKMYQIKKLMDEVESQVRETAQTIENIDGALYRMLNDLDDERAVNLHKILSNYWKLTQDEDEFLKKLANKF